MMCLEQVVLHQDTDAKITCQACHSTYYIGRKSVQCCRMIEMKRNTQHANKLLTDHHLAKSLIRLPFIFGDEQLTIVRYLLISVFLIIVLMDFDFTHHARATCLCDTYMTVTFDLFT